MPLKILLDAYNMGLPHGTGVATYGRNLSRTIKHLGHEVDVLYGGRSVKSASPLLSEIAFFDAATGKRPGQLGWLGHAATATAATFGCRGDPVPLSGSVVWDAQRPRMPAFDRLWNSTEVYRRAHLAHRWSGQFARIAAPAVDIAHWTYPIPIFHARAANLYTLHDLVPLRLPHTTLDDKKKYFQLCKRIVDTAAHIVTVSECSRQDIITLLGASPERVTNTYQAVEFPRELMIQPVEAVTQEIEGTYGLPYKGYFLFFGAIEPKKNLGRLVEAYLASGVHTPLVIVGAPGWGSDDEMRLLASIIKLHPAGQTRRILQIDYLPLARLVTLIRGAKATLFPSLYEGFGLPVVESMLLGTAVLTSDVSCLPEVAGGAALLVDPYRTASIAEGLRVLDSDTEHRTRLEHLGRLRAADFSEAAHARRLGAVYELGERRAALRPVRG